MKHLTKNEFKAIKSTDTLVIYGSGPSVAALSTQERTNLQQYDSISFNWFCKVGIPTTYYILREQASIPRRISPGEEVKDMGEIMNSRAYKTTCLIVHDTSSHSPHAYSWPMASKTMFPRHYGIVVQETKRGSPKKFGQDIFDVGVEHGKCSLTNAIHIGIWQGYKKLLFIGVDLYDTHYCWMNGKKRTIVKAPDAPHPVTKVTLDLIKNTKIYMQKRDPEFRMYVYNKESVLSKYLKVNPCP